MQQEPFFLCAFFKDGSHISNVESLNDVCQAATSYVCSYNSDINIILVVYLALILLC